MNLKNITHEKGYRISGDAVRFLNELLEKIAEQRIADASKMAMFKGRKTIKKEDFEESL